MNLRTILSAVAVMLFAACASATAQTYTLGYDQTQYNVAAGDTVDIAIILSEEIAGGETSRLAAGDRDGVGTGDGLFAFSTSVDFSSFSGGNGSRFDSFVLNDLFVAGFPGSGSGVIIGADEVSLEGNEDFAGNDTDSEDGVGGIMTDANTFQLELGTLTFNAGDAGSITTIQLQPHTDAAANPFLFADGDQPDINFTSAQIFVNAVPEPSSAAFIALLAGAGLIKRRRK